jgi:hypothetical protein
MVRVRMFRICSAVLLGFSVFSPQLVSAQIDSEASDNEKYGAHLDTEGWVHFGLHAPDAN